MVVGPSANKPANNIHDFTWALGTGMVYSIPDKFVPCMVNGGKESLSLPVILPPICVRGVIIRLTGLDDREASPVIVEENGCAASIPVNSLNVVPLFPA
jgi:hypothetical protein